MEQANLFHEDELDAIRDAARALGGNKVVGSWLWPSLSPQKAGEKLAQCLNPEHAQKLAFAEILLVSKAAAKIGCHAITTYVNRDGGYADPVWRKPEDIEDEGRRELSALLKQVLPALKKAGVEL